MTIKNLFFDLALSKAAGLLGRPGRLLRLAGQLMLVKKPWNLTRQDWQQVRQQLDTSGRLIKAVARRTYTPQSWQPVVTLIAAALYFVNPFDLIPDALLGAGLLDDLSVLTWVFASASAELKRFMQWEHLNQAH
ncbi:MAG: DUF1232 domain-containing protein [Cyclobacteriaceae bacterium]